MRRLLGVFSAGLVLAAVGCGPRPGVETAGPARTGGPERAEEERPLVKVEGVVTLDGEKVNGAMVMFLPEQEAQGRPASGVTETDGTFTLGTTGPGNGALPGSYKVVVTDPQQRGAEAQGARPPSSATRIPVAYTAPGSTPLTVNVQPGMAPLELKLTSNQR